MATMTIEAQEEKLVGLKALSEIFEIPLKVKSFQNDWILITYDLPNTKEGVKTRYEFLNKAKWLGAAQHTESVYLLPWTDRASMVALELAKSGKVYLWYTKVGDEQQAISLTETLDASLENRIIDLEKRVEKVLFHAKKDHVKQVRRMAESTWEKINGIGKAIMETGNETLASKLYQLIGSLKYAESLV